MKGYLQALLYIFTMAISIVWVSHLGDGISVAFLLLGVSLVAMLFFNLLRIRYFMRNHKTILQTPGLWLAMSISMLLVWWLSYYSTIHASASFTMALLFLWQALAAAIVKKHWIAVLLSLIVWLAIYYLAPKATPLTFLTATLAGILAYIYYRSSLAYANRHRIAALDILAIRFYPLFIFSCLYILLEIKQGIPLYTYSYLLPVLIFLLILGFLNMILPNFLSQNSVQHIGVERFSFITTWIPVLTFLLQGIFLHTWSLSLLAACLLTSLVLNLEAWLKRK